MAKSSNTRKTRPSIADIRGLPDIATMYQWYVEFGVTKGSYQLPSNEEINLRMISATIPKVNNEKLTASIGTFKVYLPGTSTYDGEITLTCVETVDSFIANWLYGWRKICTDPETNAHSVKEDIEVVMQLSMLDRNDSPIWRYRCIGCFLTNYDFGELGATSDTIKPTLTISYDYFKEGPAE